MIVRRGRPAMGSWFEALLVGDDEEHLMAVAEAALDEVGRVERLLSRFDPASEVSRIHREAAARPVRVDPEMFAILADSLEWSTRTGGYFDPCAGTVPGSVRLIEEGRRVILLDPSARLDFGGYGKGYALDVAARVLDEFGVGLALLHGGTSSVLARGRPEDAPAWRVGLRGPGGDSEVARVDLVDCALSSSAAFGPGSGPSDVVDPVAGRPLDRQAGCSVVAPTAAGAEALSTALLAMGRARAGERAGMYPGCRVAWIDRGGLEWLGEGGGPG